MFCNYTLWTRSTGWGNPHLTYPNNCCNFNNIIPGESGAETGKFIKRLKWKAKKMKYIFSAQGQEVRVNTLLYAGSAVTGKNVMRIGDISSPGCLFYKDPGMTG